MQLIKCQKILPWHSASLGTKNMPKSAAAEQFQRHYVNFWYNPPTWKHRRVVMTVVQAWCLAAMIFSSIGMIMLSGILPEIGPILKATMKGDTNNANRITVQLSINIEKHKWQMRILNIIFFVSLSIGGINYLSSLSKSGP